MVDREPALGPVEEHGSLRTRADALTARGQALLERLESERHRNSLSDVPAVFPRGSVRFLV
jgi:hypothetical protein